jgi:hypothetical protein
MNEYKAAWYRHIAEPTPLHPIVRKRIQRMDRGKPYSVRRSMKGGSAFVETRAKRKATSLVMTRALTKMSTIAATGALTSGVGIGARLGLRFLPVVGWGMLAYDLYTLGSYLMED